MTARLLALLFVAGCGSRSSTSNPDFAVEPLGDMAVAVSCNPFQQDCLNPADKCQITIVTDASGTQTTSNVCIPATSATVDEGLSCMRSQAGTLSDDDCKKGLVCTGRGQASGTVCRTVCRTSADCPMSQQCTGYDVNASTGICAPSCTLDGTDCPSGLSCTGLYSAPGASMNGILLCSAFGSKKRGDMCNGLGQCGANMLCLPVSMTAAVCALLCDGTHPCPTASGDGGASTCDVATVTTNFGVTLPNGGGACD